MNLVAQMNLAQEKQKKLVKLLVIGNDVEKKTSLVTIG
jgi:hypothetical protein